MLNLSLNLGTTIKENSGLGININTVTTIHTLFINNHKPEIADGIQKHKRGCQTHS
jgi:hypothetical protein